MKEEKTTLEVIAPTVEEAIEQGLSQLNITEEQAEIKILDKGNKGLFGLGNRQARVQIGMKTDSDDRGETSSPVVKETESVVKDQKPAYDAENQTADLYDAEHIQEAAQSVVEDLLERMRVFAKVETEYVAPSSNEEIATVKINIQGRDLSVLIGRRSETLNAFQYIASLIVSKELGFWIPLTVDVQGYRSRRERQLKKLALRLADQAIQTGRRQTLEPMPANERRLIHIALRNHPEVTTESVGDEPNRKVTISLKK